MIPRTFSLQLKNTKRRVRGDTCGRIGQLDGPKGGMWTWTRLATFRLDYRLVLVYGTKAMILSTLLGFDPLPVARSHFYFSSLERLQLITVFRQIFSSVPFRHGYEINMCPFLKCSLSNSHVVKVVFQLYLL